MSELAARGFLDGVRVLELADEVGEYCGKLLAGLGADVIKIEPPGGESTRHIGPFYEDVHDPNRSLHFWHYNFGKRGIVLDLDSREGQEHARTLAQRATIVLETRARGYLDERGLGYEALRANNPSLIYVRITPFGDDGPWAGFKGGDLIHLSLGGVVMNCGYDPEPSGDYDLPPIAPQMWQSYQITGEVAAVGILAALNYRTETGIGQQLAVSVHDAVSKNTEVDLPSWIYCRQSGKRQTGRAAMPTIREPMLAITKDGRWVAHYQSHLPHALSKSVEGIVTLLKKFGMELDLEDKKFSDGARAAELPNKVHVGAAIERLVARFQSSRELWRDAQEAGLTWAPVRRPEENLVDAHWKRRESFIEVSHSELDRTFTYVGSRWLAPGIPWRDGPRAPLLNEHADEILAQSAENSGDIPKQSSNLGERAVTSLSKRGKPFALAGLRIVDLSWILASGGAGRFFTALGAEVIKVEHESRPDPARGSSVVAPIGGRAERDMATSPLSPKVTSLNRSGYFMEINAGKRSLSLNLKHPLGKGILADLLKDADMVIEGFSPGTMDRMGFSFQRLKEINPKIIYVQQSGMGQIGSLGPMRSFGPIAQAFSGLTEMSGLPEPYPPAGIGYSYLDWCGAYNMACAMMAALYRRHITGEGCYIDASQVETGFGLTGTAILNYSADGRRWKRYGNRSPFKLAAPHGIYRTEGEDRWIAISCFTEDEWRGLLEVLRYPRGALDPRWANLDLRLADQDELDSFLAKEIIAWDRYELMQALQLAGVPAGVCQTAEDRCEVDPQLRHLHWMTELDQSEIGTWPVREFPVIFEETPAYMGGMLNRHGPNYGEDNDYVLGAILGYSTEDIEVLASKGVT